MHDRNGGSERDGLPTHVALMLRCSSASSCIKPLVLAVKRCECPIPLPFAVDLCTRFVTVCYAWQSAATCSKLTCWGRLLWRLKEPRVYLGCKASACSCEELTRHWC